MSPLRALFQKRIDGDDALLRLARLRFSQAGLGAEVYAGSPAELAWMLRFAPDRPCLPMVHLPRDIDLLAPGAEERITVMIKPFGESVAGFVLHDRRTMPDRRPELRAVAERVSGVLAASGQARLFIEYAAGLRLGEFVELGQALGDVDRVGLGVDTGHVGIRQARWEFARLRPGHQRDLGGSGRRLAGPELVEMVDAVQAAAGSALGAVQDLIRELGSQQKPVHVHLHDGHPLIPGLSDHFGFLLRVPMPYGSTGPAALDPMYGVSGLFQILDTLDDALGPDLTSITLEIHQHDGRLPLPPEDAAHLFSHWRDLANAERMNMWLRELVDNAALVQAWSPTRVQSG